MLLGGRIASLIINILCVLLLLGVGIYLLAAWGSIPDEIPAHYGASGEVTRLDGKGFLWLMPSLALALFVGFLAIERFPKLWNTGVRVTEENKFRVYGTIKSLLSSTKLIIVAAFVFITVTSSLSLSLPIWFMIVFVQLLLISSIFHIIWLFRVK